MIIDGNEDFIDNSEQIATSLNESLISISDESDRKGR